jgi:hypothetical protein
MEKQISDYIKGLSIPVSSRYLRKVMASHPDYPSLLSASDTLKQLVIPHGVARLGKEQLGTLSVPYLLHVEKDGGKYVVVSDEEELNTQPDLLDHWSGIVLQAGLFGWMAVAGVFGPADGSLWSTGLLSGLFLAAGSLVFLLKTRLKESSEAEQREAATNRVKYNPSVFTHLLLQQPQADCTPFEKELLIGTNRKPR